MFFQCRISIQGLQLVNLNVVYYALIILGLLLGWFIYERFGSRSGGVLTVPLLVIYFILDIRMIIPFIIVIVALFLMGEILYKVFLVYGRRLLYSYAILSTLVTAPVVITLGFTHIIFLSILPGILVYNIHVEGNLKRALSFTLLRFLILLSLGLFLTR